MTYQDLLLAYRDAQTAVFLLWCLLIVLSILVVYGSECQPPMSKGTGTTAWCKQHSRPVHECRDEHRP